MAVFGCKNKTIFQIIEEQGMKLIKIVSILLSILFCISFLLSGCYTYKLPDSAADVTLKEDTAVNETTQESSAAKYLANVNNLKIYKSSFLDFIDVLKTNGWSASLISEFSDKASIYYDQISKISSGDIPQQYKDFHSNYLDHFVNIDKTGTYFFSGDYAEGGNSLLTAIDDIKKAYKSIGETVEIAEFTLFQNSSEETNVAKETISQESSSTTGKESTSETTSAATTTAATTSSETTAAATATTETTPPTTEQIPKVPTKSAYLKSISNIVNEYGMVINHWNTYQKSYTDLDSLVAFSNTVLNKISQINGMLQAIVPAAGYEAAQAHFIDLGNQMYGFFQQVIAYLKGGNVDAANNTGNNFNSIWLEFQKYRNSL
jgi:hypothetical protein